VAVVSGGALRNVTPCGQRRALLCPLRECVVDLLQVIRDGDDGEQGGYEAGEARHEHEAVGQEGGQPHAEAELAYEQLAYGPP
jgi:hypothetical protein